MVSMGVYEARTRFSALLQRVQRGERITITRHGRPVAVLSPPPGEADRTVDEAVREILALRKGHVLGEDLTVRDLVEAGRG